MTTAYTFLPEIVNFENFKYSLKTYGTAFLPDVSNYYGSTYQQTVIKNASDLADFLSRELRIPIIPDISADYPDALKIFDAVSANVPEQLEEAFSKLEHWFEYHMI